MKQLNKIRFNVRAWSEILTDPAVGKVLLERGHRIKEAASLGVTDGEWDRPDFKVTISETKTNRPQRVRVVVSTNSYAASRAESERGVLTRALGAGQGQL